MVAYSVKARFEAPIRAGIKPHTMRNERLGRGRHVRPGEQIQIYYAMRTKHCRLIGRAICRAVTPVRIDFKRCTVLIEGRPMIHGIERLDAFAVTDGFAHWGELRAFWMKEHGSQRKRGQPEPPPLTVWRGVLIEWTNFQGEPQ